MRHPLFLLCLLCLSGNHPALEQTGRPVPPVSVRGGVYSQQDSTTGVPGAEVVFRSGNDSVDVPHRAFTAADGSYELVVPGGRTYRVDVHRRGQRVARREVSVPDTGTPWMSIYVDYPEGFGLSGAITEPAPALFFAVRQCTLRPEGRALLTRLSRVLRDQPALQMRVEGHADGREVPAHHPDPAGYLTRLGAQRAGAVADFLRGLGVPAARLVAVGYGARQPAAPSDGPENRQLNRRVDLKGVRL